MPATKAELGAKIRSKKQKELTLPELRKAWDAQLTDAEREALAAVYRKDIAPGKEVTAAEAVAYALHHCLERESCPAGAGTEAGSPALRPGARHAAADRRGAAACRASSPANSTGG